MSSDLCFDRRVHTLQTVCSTAPLPSAECQDSASLSIFPFTLHQQIQRPFQRATEDGFSQKQL